MKLSLFRLSDNRRFAHCYSATTSDIHGWGREAVVEEFDLWPNDSIDSAEDGDGNEIVRINDEPVAILRFSVEQPILARRVA